MKSLYDFDVNMVTQRLVTDPAFLVDLSPEERQSLIDDPDLLAFTFQEEATTVLSFRWTDEWNPDGGDINIVRWNGLYRINSDIGPVGPFSSLEDALDHEFFYYATSDVELSCSELPLDELLEIAMRLVEEGGEIVVNDQAFKRSRDALTSLS